MDKKVMILGLILAIAISACAVQDTNDDLNSQGSIGRISLESTDELKKFNSKQEIIMFLDSVRAYDNGYYNMRSFGMMEEMVGADAALGAPSAKSSVSGGTSDYSTTNIQVEGVDEADFVKNDGEFIYMVVQNKLVIVDAYPAGDAEIVSETDIPGNAQDLYINGDTVVVFTNEYGNVFVFPEYDAIPTPRYIQKTEAIVYDVSDRENPEKKFHFDVKGYYITSRMIGDYVYLVAQDSVYYHDRLLDLPAIAESGKVVVRPDIYYFDNPEAGYNFNTVMSFNIDSGEAEAKTFMMGYTNTIYVSEDNIYITYQKNLPYLYYEQDNEQRFYDVVLPLLPSEVRSAIDQIRSEDITEYERWDKISAKLEEMYNGMDEEDKDKLMQDIYEAVDEYELKRQEERSKTVIHKIAIKDGTLEYAGRGEVKGYLLNQFSMDEDGGNLRVATTFSSWMRDGSVMYNNVYVLDEDLEVIGELEKIAPDESIYSTRFIGDRLYMVTFKRMDPFFVIDMSNPENPKVLGELKIPGFSDYLHPYDENHIIGIGKETGENEWGGVSVKGLKLALFDVSDVTNPELVDKYELGDAGSDSEALNDHKAFLFDREKELLVIPVRIVDQNSLYDPMYGYYRQKVWQGAYVFTLTEEGFSLRGKVTHYDADERADYWYYGEKAVRRALYMDDVLYTISTGLIKMNDIDELDDINEIELPYTNNYYPEPYLVRDAIGADSVAIK